MKKLRSAIIAACLGLCLSFTLLPLRRETATSSGTTRFINYTWYKDEELTDPTGSICTISAEVYRLQVLFPGYTFSSTFTLGLSPYEYGDHYFYPVQIIYSNR